MRVPACLRERHRERVVPIDWERDRDITRPTSVHYTHANVR